jgi:phage gp29-like protein
VEERDLHYAGVLGTRKRSVSQLEITVEAACDDARHEAQAEAVREWLKRDELADELFDMLDAVGKGYSFTEIIWDTSEGQWRPDRLEWRDPRWFRFERNNATTPLLIGEHGEETPLPGFKFVRAVMRAKSGLPVRSGLARIVAWAWMFKAFTQRDWAIFTQTYGQPVRIGKYGPGATEKDRDTLYRAVANIAGDCAAIIPESMLIEFVESKNLGTGHSNYLERSDWLDQQVSKATLGQTATTDAIAGGHAVGREHRQVQEDIERADAKTLSAIINRDLIRPWMMLEHGEVQDCPRVKIGRAEETDIKTAVEAVTSLVPFGLRVGQNQMRDIIGIGAPAEDDDLLTAKFSAPPLSGKPLAGTPTVDTDQDPEREEARHTEEPKPARLPLDAIAESAAAEAGPAVAQLLATLREMAGQAGDLEELRALLEATGSGGDLADLEAALRQAMLLAELTGRSEIEPSPGPD